MAALHHPHPASLTLSGEVAERVPLGNPRYLYGPSGHGETLTADSLDEAIWDILDDLMGNSPDPLPDTIEVYCYRQHLLTRRDMDACRDRMLEQIDEAHQHPDWMDPPEEADPVLDAAWGVFAAEMVDRYEATLYKEVKIHAVDVREWLAAHRGSGGFLQ